MLFIMKVVEKEINNSLFTGENFLAEKKINEKVIKTKKRLSKSLINLLKEKAITEIDVSQLCQFAGIHRTTFYKHYESPRDLLNELINEFFKKIEKLILFIGFISVMK